jgi:signal transduction histidine kinase
VFLNLLDNAVKYTHPGGEAVVCLSAADGSIQVEVRDDGIGIDPQDLSHVFEPLYRGEKARGQPGTGLGLTIVRAILEQHGSTVGVQSAPGRGTVFRFVLPSARGTP